MQDSQHVFPIFLLQSLLSIPFFSHPSVHPPSMVHYFHASSYQRSQPFQIRKSRNVLQIPLLISLTITSLTTVLLTSIHHSEGGGLCLHACVLAQGVKRMSFLLRHHLNNNVFLPKLRFCPSRNTMPHHGSSLQQQLQSPHSTAIINSS
jgi:hypothetical protein